MQKTPSQGKIKKEINNCRRLSVRRVAIHSADIMRPQCTSRIFTPLSSALQKIQHRGNKSAGVSGQSSRKNAKGLPQVLLSSCDCN